MALNRTKSQDSNLPYQLSEIPDQLRHRARTELFEDEDTRVHSLKLLKSMLTDEPGLHWQDDDFFLLSFLRARKFDVKKAFHLAKTFYTVVGKHDELYLNLNYADVKRTLEHNALGFLPYRDTDGSVILYIRTSHWNPPEDSLGDIMRALTCSLFHANLYPATQIAGFKVILNFTGFSMKHFPHISPSYLWLIAEALQNCFPGRFRAIYLLNENAVVSSFWAIIKNFLKKKIRERIHFYGKNVKKLHKHISPSILPADVLGELPTFDNTEWRNLMEESADHFCEIFTYGYKKTRTKSQSERK